MTIPPLRSLCLNDPTNKVAGENPATLLETLAPASQALA